MFKINVYDEEKGIIKIMYGSGEKEVVAATIRNNWNQVEIGYKKQYNSSEAKELCKMILDNIK